MVTMALQKALLRPRDAPTPRTGQYVSFSPRSGPRWIGGMYHGPPSKGRFAPLGGSGLSPRSGAFLPVPGAGPSGPTPGVVGKQVGRGQSQRHLRPCSSLHSCVLLLLLSSPHANIGPPASPGADFAAQHCHGDHLPFSLQSSHPSEGTQHRWAQADADFWTCQLWLPGGLMVHTWQPPVVTVASSWQRGRGDSEGQGVTQRQRLSATCPPPRRGLTHSCCRSTHTDWLSYLLPSGAQRRLLWDVPTLTQLFPALCQTGTWGAGTNVTGGHAPVPSFSFQDQSQRVFQTLITSPETPGERLGRPGQIVGSLRLKLGSGGPGRR